MIKEFILVINRDTFFSEVALKNYLKENKKQLPELYSLAKREGYDSVIDFLHDDSVVICWTYEDMCVLFWPDYFGHNLTEDGLFFYNYNE